MAVTRIHPIKTTLNKALAYIEDPDKTSDYLLVSGYHCEPLTAAIEFAMTVEMAKRVSGNYEKTGGADVLAEHMIQSFSPEDNITPEQAHEIGRKWADEILQGKYEYVLSTHLDKGHIHNHIIFNATSFCDYKKFENYKIAAHLRDVSDKICVEYGLSVIKNRNKSKGKTHYEMQQRKAGLSWKMQVQESIDKAIFESRDFESFREVLAKDGIEILDGKRITFHKIGVVSSNGRAGKVRGDRIGAEYTKDRILERLAEPKEKKFAVGRQPETQSADPASGSVLPPVFFSYDKKVEWQARNTRLAATKELAAALMTIRKEQIMGCDDFSNKLTHLQNQMVEMRGTIKQLDEKNEQYKTVAKYLIAYNQHLPVYQELQKQNRFTRQLFEKRNSGDLTAFKYAVEQLEKVGVNTNVDPDKVIALVKEQDGKVVELFGQLRSVEDRILNIRKSQEIVNRLNRDNQTQSKDKSRGEEI